MCILNNTIQHSSLLKQNRGVTKYTYVAIYYNDNNKSLTLNQFSSSISLLVGLWSREELIGCETS